MTESIKYHISPDGQKVDVNAEGFSGQGCLEFAKKAMVKVGRIEKMDKKPEFFDMPHAHTKI